MISSEEMFALYQQVASQKAHLQTIFKSLRELIWFKDVNGTYLTCNPMFERFIGLSEADIVGKTDEVITTQDNTEFLNVLQRHAPDSKQPQVREEWLQCGSDGQRYLLEISITPVHDDSRFIGVLGLGRDITEKRLAENRITNLAYFDTLTGLPNRTLVRERIEQAMQASTEDQRFGALLLIDLDHFKMLNDTLGHEMGDRLLKQVARRLTPCVRQSDTVARIGGDEFVVVLTQLSTDAAQASVQAQEVGMNILASLNQPYVINERAHRSTPSIGATLFQGRQTSLDNLLKQAELAMYKTKEAGRNSLLFFDPSLENAVMERVQMEADLRIALLEKQFFLHYQAQTNESGDLKGCEVLIRWQHPQRGFMPPMDFIPIAESTRLILPIGQWVLEQACTQLALWAHDPDLAQLTLSVNVSALQFNQPDFLGQVVSQLALTGARPSQLKLELTESLLVANVEEIIAKMHLLKAQGIGLSLDDFGTGYSSLTYLKRMPLEQLKIDRSFVNDMLTSPNDASIVNTIISLSKNLGLNVIAEGVENAAQRDFLNDAGCPDYQGYFYSRPMPLAQFLAFARRKSSLV